ncbi:polymer-forming cytoskeletal protein [Vreelandella stevensii]|uniref:polymer-forming cytoskeletal protein n=1 Tax=Vreelandella stevensii TaxID=502821 RepID=UPI003748D835
MLTETWLIVVGVAVMTIIVMDGRRRKRRLGVAMITHPEPEALMVEVAVECANDAVVGSHVGAATRIHGIVTAQESISISGSVQGEVHTTHGITLTSLASVQGLMSAGELACHAGATVNAAIVPGPSVEPGMKKPA